ncbi:MAG TPA: AAA family ATPase [Terriglobales bacterium]|nr:AAA family ATPase [Terriglobales bacterium]
MATSGPIIASSATIKSALPSWARDLINLYESNASNQFILFGNVNDQQLIPAETGYRIGSLNEFLVRVLLARFDVILSYDVGNGIRIEKGGDVFSTWPEIKQNTNQSLPIAPRPAIERLTHYLRYVANLARLNRGSTQVAVIVRSADLVAPMLGGGNDPDVNAMAVLLRDWASDSLLTTHSLASFLIAENLNDLHPLIAANPRGTQLKIALPSTDDLRAALTLWQSTYPESLKDYAEKQEALAAQLSGTTLSAIESSLKRSEHLREPVNAAGLVRLKKQLVEKDCNGLVEFLESQRTLEDVSGLEKVKAWLRQDIQLWQGNDTAALPKGYLICGPVGTGKTYLVECLAGEASVPVVKLKNFRDKWVGSTEGNLEKIFRLLQALGRCYVFIDEADQALGRRDAGQNDSGLSGRIYSMIAEEMGSSSNRGKIIWVLASSRPDLIEVDLKRPGRIDTKIPLFPTTTAQESLDLLSTLLKRRNLELAAEAALELEACMPTLLTPGAAEALAVKIYRQVRTTGRALPEAIRESLCDYQNPVPLDVLEAQIRLAARETSDLDFVPPCFRVSDASYSVPK